MIYAFERHGNTLRRKKQRKEVNNVRPYWEFLCNIQAFLLLKIYCSCWYVSWNISSFFVLVFTWMYNYWNEWNYYFHYKGTFYLTVLDAQTLFLIIAQAVSIIWFFLRKWLRVYWEHIFVNFRTSRVTALYIMNILTCIRKTAEW